MLRRIARYAHWLHGRWPAGTVERFPEVRAGGATRVPGVYVAGDLVLLVADWSLQGISRQGHPVDLHGIATDIARRGTDGRGLGVSGLLGSEAFGPAPSTAAEIERANSTEADRGLGRSRLSDMR